ncbi:MAG: hypothetical protein ACP5QN_02435 [Minisyncoccia bacterium]
MKKERRWKMPEVQVEKVNKKNNSVKIRVLNTFLDFQKVNNKIKLVAKYSFSQIYDPNELYVPKNLFLKACQMAGAILNGKKKGGK